ncbi:AsmA family protein [Acuticoccus sp. MNP-M23]|uniref:AsmA family protein n=1 Tax=Acuticoccus sp. MNP-M23 TaxID=3072793 RepID=UPI0028158C2F|nr:AsmA family protein [Acuticoccus sp. MNP-M23]WMS41168.1 AsmA family protein [Acuticoccus sp. MNP-M23]
MNWIVITIGTALVLALFAALVGPVLVDWTAYRTTIEANASRVLGTEVVIDGEAELRILPSPRVRLTDVRIGSTDAPLMRAEAVVLDVDLLPLLSREFRVLGLKLEHPVATVSLDRNGSLALPELTVDSRFTSVFDVDHITVEEIAVAGGSVNVVDRRSGRSTAITNIDMTGEARTLRGPFAATGEATIGGVRHAVRLGGGTVESGTMPLSARINPEGSTLALSFEGALVPRPRRLSLRGEVALESSASTPWSVRGTLSANAQDVQLQRATVRYGAGAQTLELAANATYALTRSDPVAIALEGRQIDLDRMARALMPARASGTPAGSPSPDEIVPLLARYLAPVSAALAAPAWPDVPLDIELAINTVLAGGSVIRDVSAEASAARGTIALNRAEAVFPGDTTVDVVGRIADAFDGTVKISASQPALLARWWTGTRFARGPMDPVLLEADIRATADTLEAQRLSLRIGESRANGRASYARKDGAPVLDVAMTAPRLDIADVADAAAVLAATGAALDTMPEVLMDLSVDQLMIGGVEGAALNIDGAYRSGALTIDAISAENLAGARLFARGEINNLGDNPVGVIEGSLDVEDGNQLAAAIRALAPNDTGASALAARVTALAPAHLDIALTGQPGGSTADLSLGLDGTLGGTTLTLKALSAAPGPNWKMLPSELTLDARNDNGAVLLRQFGLDAAERAGPAHLAVNLATTAEDALAGRVTFDGFDIDAVFDGTVANGAGLAPTGRLAVTAAGLSGLADALGTTLPASGTIDVAATLAPESAGIALDGLKGTVDGVIVTADVIVDPFAAPLSVDGTLALSEADLAGIARLFLGDPKSANGDGKWATAALGSPLLSGTDIALGITAETLTVGQQTVRDASFDLDVNDTAMSLRNARGRVADGTATGQLQITRRGAAADIAFSLALDDASLRPLLPSPDGTPVATGSVSLTAEASGSGYTVAGIVGSLAGEGSLHLRDARLEGFNGAPFPLLSEPVAGEPPSEADVAAAFAAHLAAGALALPALDVPFSIADGTVTIKEAALPGGTVTTRASAKIDLAASMLQSDWTVVQQTPDETPVSALVRFTGPVAEPVRSIDVSAIAGWLSLRALERQVEAVEAQNAELEAEAEAINPALPGEEPASPPEATSPPDEDANAANPTDGIADLIDGSDAAAPFDMDGPPAEAPPVPPAPPSGDRSQRSTAPDVQTAQSETPGPGASLASRVRALDDALTTYETRQANRESVRAELLRRLGVDPQTAQSRAQELATAK